MRKSTIEEKWHNSLKQPRSRLKTFPTAERDALMRKARQLETASQMNQWLSSPELRPPE
jgi:hypothetical protein